MKPVIVFVLAFSFILFVSLSVHLVEGTIRNGAPFEKQQSFHGKDDARFYDTVGQTRMRLVVS
jgi:hypothetical protein